jgi:hypothetical protein
MQLAVVVLLGPDVGRILYLLALETGRYGIPSRVSRSISAREIRTRLPKRTAFIAPRLMCARRVWWDTQKAFGRFCD